ncbi:MAG: hypothetical protein H7X89_01985 [Rhizobiales bacterium]|nr:hypothetical protein [Hyphomicrobiales bacterium]
MKRAANVTPSSPTLSVYEAYPAAMRKRLLVLRKLILSTAAATKGVGKLEETL